MRLHLSIQHPTDGEREYLTQEPTVEIGRDPKATLPLTDGQGTVSWRHARIELAGGAARIEDLGSTNGTYVNGQRLAKGQPAPLRVKDVIQFGQKGPRLHVRGLDGGGAPAVPTMMARAPMPETDLLPPFAAHNGSPVRLPTALAAVPAPVATSQSGPSTRLMLVQTQQRFRRFTILALLGGAGGIGVVLLALGIGVIVLLNSAGPKTNPDDGTTNKDKDGDANKEQRLTNEAVFERAVKSTAYIRIHTKPNNQGAYTINMGSGVLIDRDRRLVATAYHVIHGFKEIPVAFPKYANGNLLTNEEDYAPKGNLNGFLIGKIWASDPGLDLAIIELPSVPADVPECKLAKESPPRAASIHAIGGKPQGNTSLWVYSHGDVRAVEFVSVDTNAQRIQAWMVITENPINHGNSGGPLVNDRCELVGICSNMDLKATNVSRFIDIRHVKEVLKERPQKVQPGGK